MKSKKSIIRTEKIEITFKDGKEEIYSFFNESIPYDFNFTITKIGSDINLKFYSLYSDDFNIETDGYSIHTINKSFASEESAMIEFNNQKLHVGKKPLTDIIHHKFSILKDGGSYILYSILITKGNKGFHEEDIHYNYSIE